MAKQRTVFGGGGSVFGENTEIAHVDLNLTPLMDVMSNILFFLMASVGASVVALLPASLPTRSESAAATEPPVTQVMMTLQITKDGFKGWGQNERLPKADTEALRFELKKAGGAEKDWAQMPYDALTDKLLAIKTKYRDSDTVIVLPDPTVPYDVIIRTMDASRGVGNEPQKDMFTKVVISDLVK